jgi:hypothetical protein
MVVVDDEVGCQSVAEEGVVVFKYDLYCVLCFLLKVVVGDQYAVGGVFELSGL